MDWFLNLVNIWLANNPVVQIVVVLIGVAVIRGIPWAFSKITGKIKSEADEKHESYSQLDRIESRLNSINGSIEKSDEHQKNAEIHRSASLCAVLHQGLIDEQRKHLDNMAENIYKKIDELAGKIAYTQGRMDAERGNNHNAT